MWSVEYVQVPVELKTKISDIHDAEKTQPNSSASTTTPAINIPKRKMSRHGSCDSYNEARPAIDLLKDFKDPDYLVAKEVELGSSADSESHYINRIKNRIPTTKAEQDKDIEEVFSRLDSNLSTASSASDLCKGDDGASVSSDIEELSVQEVDSSSVKSGDHVDPAVDAAADLCETGTTMSDQPDPCPSQPDPCPSQSEPNLLSGVDGSLGDGGEGSKSQSLERTGSPGFEVIGDAEVEHTKKTMEDMMKRNKPSGKHHLREGGCLLSVGESRSLG